MLETPKAKPESEEQRDADADWANDQTRREYYYDDAHGYEIFADTEDDEPGAKITPEPGGIDEK